MNSHVGNFAPDGSVDATAEIRRRSGDSQKKMSDEE